MAEEININLKSSKKELYQELLPQIKALIQGESDQIARLGNFCAALKYSFNWLWVGFYFVKENELVLGPFQGPVACTRIKYGKGVCGKSWIEKKVIIVPDVNTFPGHIACSSLSQSEIVLPVFDSKGEVIMILDVDSENLNNFDSDDEKYLTELISYL